MSDLANKSFTKSYVKTYLWQGLGLILHMLSLFIVIPWITDNKVVYGVYSICISTAMFLTYADLGFVSAALKYAGECFARGESKREAQFYGFSSFILTLFVALIAGVYLLFSIKPELLIKDIANSEHIKIASDLLLIQAIFSINTVLQRLSGGIFQVRVEQYVYQQINIFGSAVKILSVFYFFGEDKYDIVGYFLFIKSVEFLIQFISLLIIRRKYNFPIFELIKSFRWTKEMFQATKKLALSSLFVTVMWVLYYELDIIVIGKMFGAQEVAIFAVAFTFMQFLRSLTSIVLSPFQSRYNHFVGLGEIQKLKTFVNKIVLFSMPVFVLGIFSIVLIAENLVLTWAGPEYANSGFILQLLIITYMFSFVTVPGANVFVAMEKIKDMYRVNFIMMALYWIGIFATKNLFGMLSFPAFKLLSASITFLFYFTFLIRFLESNFWTFFKSTIVRLILPIACQLLLLLWLKPFLPTDKGALGLGMVILSCGLATILGFVVLYFTSNYYKTLINSYTSKIIIPKKYGL